MRHETGAEALTEEWRGMTGPVVDQPAPQINPLLAFLVNTLPLLLLLVGCALPAVAAGESQEIQVPSSPFSEGIFPCSGCHSDLPVTPGPILRRVTGWRSLAEALKEQVKMSCCRDRANR